MDHSDHSHHHAVQPDAAEVLSTAAPENVHDAHHDHATSHEGIIFILNRKIFFPISEHLMKMWFHGGASETILFEWWRIETCWGRLHCIKTVNLIIA